MEIDAAEFIDNYEQKQLAFRKLIKPTGSIFDGIKQYINSYNLYLRFHEKIPSKISIHHTESYKVIKRIESEFSDRIIEKHYLRHSIKEIEKYKYSHVIYILINQIVIDIELTGEIGILFNESSEEEAIVYENLFRDKIRRERESKIHMLSQGAYGTDLVPLKVKKPVLDISLNYNEDLGEMHKFLMSELKIKDHSGLVLLHGKPGTGKSTYIRYLINCQKKKVIFLPPAVAGSLDSPSMTSILVENPNSIFIIEDAEELIKSRESAGASNISMLLNLTDGILGECLGTLIICTFNTDLKNIDEALLRKGRLIASYKFEELSIDKLIRLKDHLGLGEMKITEGMVLSDLYHTHENNFGKTKNKKSVIGFQGKNQP